HPSGAVRQKTGVRPLLEDNVSALPRFIVDQTPFVTRARVIGGDQDLSGMHGEAFAAFGREFKYARQRDHILRNGVIVPVKGRMRSSLLKEDGLGCDQFIAAYAAVRYVRVAVWAS